MYIEGGIYNKFNHNHINSNTNISQIRVNCELVLKTYTITMIALKT
jgi:hypothetical protein